LEKTGGKLTAPKKNANPIQETRPQRTSDPNTTGLARRKKTGSDTTTNWEDKAKVATAWVRGEHTTRTPRNNTAGHRKGWGGGVTPRFTAGVSLEGRKQGKPWWLNPREVQEAIGPSLSPLCFPEKTDR